VAIPLLLTGLGFVIASATTSNLVALLALSVSMICPLMFLGPFWGFSSAFLGGRAAAGAIALVSAVASLGGFVGPNVVGVLREATGSYGPGMITLAAALAVSALAVVALGRTIRSRGPELSAAGSRRRFPGPSPPPPGHAKSVTWTQESPRGRQSRAISRWCCASSATTSDRTSSH